jgi:hypothetical protein
MMRSHLSMSLILLVSLASLAHAEDGVTSFKIKRDASSVTYHVVHKLHKVAGVSKSVDGRVRMQAGGPTQVAIRVPVESFDSDNVNRDAHMKEVTEAARFPNVEVKAVADGVAMPASFPSTIQKTWKAQVTVHGVTQMMDIPVSVTFQAADRVVATTHFDVSFDLFKIERPSLMFVKVDDAINIEASLTFTP